MLRRQRVCGHRARLGLVSGFSPILRSGSSLWSRSGGCVTISEVTMRQLPAIRVFQALLGLSALALGVLAYRVQVDNLPQPVYTTEARSLANVAVALAFLVAGLIAWWRRPASRLGPLMIVACFALLSRQMRYSHDEVAFTVFFLLGELGYVLVAHVAL